MTERVEDTGREKRSAGSGSEHLPVSQPVSQPLIPRAPFAAPFCARERVFM